MFIYNGKFNWHKNAMNETITIVFPAGFVLNDPVSAYWQWDSDGLINRKATASSSGVVNSVTATADGYSRIHFSLGYYTLNAIVTSGYKTLTVTMRGLDLNDVSQPFDLAAMHINPASIPSTTVYTGALEWYSYAKTEMTTLVVPYGITEGAFFGLYHQWTVDAHGVEKANVRVNGVFQDVEYGADGTTTASFKGGYYTYSFKFNGEEASWVLSSPKGDMSQGNKLRVTYRV